MDRRKLGVALLVLLSVAVGSVAAVYDLATDTMMIAALLIGIAAMIVVIFQQKSAAN